MMKKRLLILSACAVICLPAVAQPLACTRPGTEFEYAEYDVKGNLKGYTLTRVESCEKNEDGWLVVKNREQSLDLQRNPVMHKIDGERLPVEQVERIVVRADDMLLPFDELLSDLPAGEGVEISVTGDEYAIPFVLEAGQFLPDAHLLVTAANGDRQVKMMIGITDRAVLAFEEIITPAGKFDTFKIAETLTVKMMFFKITMKHTAWYAPGIGIVREEEQTKKGKPDGYSELIALREPST